MAQRRVLSWTRGTDGAVATSSLTPAASWRIVDAHEELVLFEEPFRSPHREGDSGGSSR